MLILKSVSLKRDGCCLCVTILTSHVTRHTSHLLARFVYVLLKHGQRWNRRQTTHFFNQHRDGALRTRLQLQLREGAEVTCQPLR
jgi:hypothetical protein